MNKKKKQVDRIYYIGVGIMAVLFFIFHTCAFLKGIFYSFTDWKGYGNWDFVGIKNYFYVILKNQLIS